jgi:hypothetical protein
VDGEETVPVSELPEPTVPVTVLPPETVPVTDPPPAPVPELPELREPETVDCANAVETIMRDATVVRRNVFFMASVVSC